MHPESTPEGRSTSTTPLSALYARDRALDAELVEITRGLRCGLDDLGACLEARRQVRAQITALEDLDGAR